MADDKRAEAMRKAVEESNKKHGKKDGSSAGAGKGSKLDIKALADKHGDKVAGVKDKAIELWHNKTGRLAIIVAGCVLLLLIIASAISNGASRVQDAPVQYKISDAILCVYEADTASGYAYDAYVEITNTGSSYIYPRDISFAIQDSETNRLMIDKQINFMPAVIAPGQKGYLFKFGTELTGVYSPELTFNLVPSFNVMRAEKAPHSYPVDHVTIGYGMSGQKMVCQLSNDTAKFAESIYCVGLTYNDAGHCTGISGTFLLNVEPHVNVNVQFDPMMMIRPWRNQRVVDYAVYAY